MLSLLGLAVVCYAVYFLATSDHKYAVAVREWVKGVVGDR